MTQPQQARVFKNLDAEIRESDYELWRTKQVNDWLNGVWAQVYGTMYGGVIGPVLKIREIGRVAGPLMLAAWLGVAVWRRKRAEGEAVSAAGIPGALPLGGADGGR